MSLFASKKENESEINVLAAASQITRLLHFLKTESMPQKVTATVPHSR